MDKLQEIGSLFLVALLVAVISFPIILGMARWKRKLLFLFPIIFFILAAFFWITGFIAQDWGRLGLLIYAGFATVLFVGTGISSIAVYFWEKRRSIRDGD